MALMGLREKRLRRARLVSTCIFAQRMDAGLASARVLPRSEQEQWRLSRWWGWVGVSETSELER